MREPTREDWDKLPMSDEAQAALSEWVQLLLHSGDDEAMTRACQKFNKIRAGDMERYLKAQEGE